ELALVKQNAHRSAQRRLQRPAVDLSVGLHRVAVADREECAGHMDRDVKGGAGHQFLEVDIAGMESRHAVWNVAALDRWRDADGAPEWRGLDGDARAERNGAGRNVDPEQLVARVGEVVRQRAAAAESGPTEGMQKLKSGENLDLQRIPGLRAFHIDRAG